MAFPSINSALAGLLKDVQQAAYGVRFTSQRFSATLAAGDVTVSQVLELADSLRTARGLFATAASRPGMAAYAQEQLGQDVSADFTNMIDGIDSCVNWIVAALPKDGDGYILVQRLNPDGSRADRTFTPAQTTPLRTLLTALAATIE